ncbi:hypothetical protein WMF38_10695 [Sorangium sp. So ce118]
MGASVLFVHAARAAVLAAVLASTFPLRAAAADRSPQDREVQELIDEAEKAAKRLDLARAREYWARVNALKPSTMAVCQLGQFDLRLDRLEEAAAELSTCVEQMPAPASDIERRRYEVRHADLAAVRQRVAELHISPPPGTARILVDGREVSAGGPVFVAPGQHEVTAMGKQGQVAHALVKVAARDSRRVSLAFEIPQVSAARVRVPAPVAPAPARPRPNRLFIGAGATASVAMLGAGVVLHLAGDAAEREAAESAARLSDGTLFSIGQMLAVLTPFARAWEELGKPPELPRAELFAEPSGARCEPAEGAPFPVEDEAAPLGSGEQVGRASALLTPRPSEAPDTVKSVMPPRDARDNVTHAPPVAAPRPPDTPDTLKSAVPPRDARDTVTHAPPVALRSPPSLDLPDLDPILLDPIPPVPPAPSTSPRSPRLPVPPAPSTPPRSSGTPGRRSPARRLGAVLVLALLLWKLRSAPAPMGAVPPQRRRPAPGAGRPGSNSPNHDTASSAAARCTASAAARRASLRHEPKGRCHAAGHDHAVEGWRCLLRVRRLRAAPILSQGDGFMMRSTSYFALGAAALLGCVEDFKLPEPRTNDSPVLLWVGETPDFPTCPGGRLDYWDGWTDVHTDPQY